MTALHLAAGIGQEAVARLLLKRGADVAARTHGGGATPLHAAARGGHLPLLACLLDSGAPLHATTCEGHTALHVAAHAGQASAVQLLIARGAVDAASVSLEDSMMLLTGRARALAAGELPEEPYVPAEASQRRWQR